ncbi:MAG TPA: HAD-IA family hydrolase [Rhodocyclaceae bacterium]|nr:HAD-IA family hydrolase [Rhodocyclaceae bacterium]
MSTCPYKGILFDWVGVLVLPEGEPERNDPRSVAACFRAYEPLWSLLPRLQESFAMCVVNNGAAATVPYFEERFCCSRFMPFMNSEIEGVTKPDPEIYLRACRLIGVRPSEVIYLDDAVPELPADTAALGMTYVYWPDPHRGFQAFKRLLNDSGIAVS